MFTAPSFAKRIFCIFILHVSAFVLHAQQIKFQLAKAPNENEAIFLAGNINGWNPCDTQYKFDKLGTLVISAKSGGIIEFKCTLGSWDKVEVSTQGNGIANRVLKVTNDTTVYIAIESWSHLFTQKVKQHTASVNVALFDAAFMFPSLGYTKKINVYLPPDYQQTNKKYAVLYMHDGQNVFDEFTSGYGEWHVDEALDSLYEASRQSIIVVAIDHGNEKRINEYNPYDSSRFGKGVGELYLKDIAEVLKPIFDKRFRTYSSAGNTWLAGSSMGGLISTYGVFIYPKTFGGAGIFSPAYWVNKSVDSLAKKFVTKRNRHNKFFFYAGGNESKQMLPDMQRIMAIVCNPNSRKCTVLVNAEAQHNEAAWTIQFHTFLKFMIANGILR